MNIAGGSMGAALWLGCLLTLISGSAAQALSSQAHSGPVEVQIELSPDSPVIGDPMVLSIRVTAESAIEVLMPEFGEALDRFRIVDFVPREKIDDSGRTSYSQRYTLQAPASGNHLIPSILIEFVDRRPGQRPAPENQDAYEILTEALPFEVASAMPEDVEAELAPPMGRLEKPNHAASDWLWWMAALALVAGIGAFWFLRSWHSTHSLTAWEQAQRELDELLSGVRPAPERIGPFFVALSDIIRRYLEDQFSLRSPELTTERFLELVADSPDLNRRHQGLLQEFLNQCDLVKFAGHIPSGGAIDEAIDAAKRFLAETRELISESDSVEAMGEPRTGIPQS